MGSDVSEEALQRAARSVTALYKICHNFDERSGVPIGTSAHSTLSDSQDMAKVVSTVFKKELFSVIPGRKHSFFKQIHQNP